MEIHLQKSVTFVNDTKKTNLLQFSAQISSVVCIMRAFVLFLSLVWPPVLKIALPMSIAQSLCNTALPIEALPRDRVNLEAISQQIILQFLAFSTCLYLDTVTLFLQLIFVVSVLQPALHRQNTCMNFAAPIVFLLVLVPLFSAVELAQVNYFNSISKAKRKSNDLENIMEGASCPMLVLSQQRMKDNVLYINPKASEMLSQIDWSNVRLHERADSSLSELSVS